MAPKYLSDAQLAQFPVIVIARWKRVPWRHHHRTSEKNGDRVIHCVEAYTKIHVERVVAGSLMPGVHTIKVGYGIAWRLDGTGLYSGTSTEIAGDVSDLNETNIWFLRHERSWDDSDPQEYLAISNYRAIQPAALEPYFRALTSVEPGPALSSLLGASDPEVVGRVLKHLAGGLWPWPWFDEFEVEVSGIEQEAILHEHADAVAAVVQRRGLKDLRACALAVHAEMTRGQDLRLMRSLLADRNSAVRATAVALLVRLKDVVSIPRFFSALTGKVEGRLALAIIEDMQHWEELGLVPALISLLETDGYDAPAVKAREVLHGLTRFWFPFHIAASLAAWNEALKVKTPRARQRLLARRLPVEENPLSATVAKGKKQNPVCRIANNSKSPVSVTRLPSGMGAEWSLRGCGCSMITSTRLAVKKSDFILLQPGETLTIPLSIDAGFLKADPTRREMSLLYASCGAKWGMHAWMGSVRVEFLSER